MSRSSPPEQEPSPVGAPEVWQLDHPDRGKLELAVGRSRELRAVDPGYPLGERSEGGGPRLAATTDPGYVLLRDGVVVARAGKLGDQKISISADPPGPGEFTAVSPTVRGPRVHIRTSALDTAVRQVTFREGRDVIHFDPSPGSAAEARLTAIAASPWKRVVYPLAAGLGRSGWAIAMIILLPVLGRILEPVLRWIAARVPDFEIPWPDLSLPAIPWPDLPLPSVDLPDISVPGWVEFLLEYSKVWVPLLVGVALAVAAVRHSRRSQRIRQDWEAEGGDERAGDDRTGR